MDNDQEKEEFTAWAKTIGENLRDLRETANLAQHEVASLLNVSYQQIQKYESGQNRIPVEKLFYLKLFYGVPYDVFFRRLDMSQAIEPEKRVSSSVLVYSKFLGMRDKVLKARIEDILLLLVEYENHATSRQTS